MSIVDIFNRALAVIGHDRTITATTDTSIEAVLCNRFYPSARDNILSAYNWEFARIITNLTVPANSSATWNIPNDFVKMVSVRDQNGNSILAIRNATSYTIHNSSSASVTAGVTYISNGISGLESAMPHLVSEAVVYELAQMLFGPMVGNVQDNNGAALFESYMKLAASKLASAISAEDSEHAFLTGKRGNDVEIRTNMANRTMAVIGSTVTITDFDTDPSPAAARIRLLYPTARDFVLSAYDWEFASVDQNVSVSGSAAWSIPNGFVKLVSVRDGDGNAMRTVRSGRTLTIYSNSPSSVTATVRYVSSAIQNFELSMPSLFSEAVVMKLAAILSGETQADQQNGERQKTPDFATALAAAIAAEQSERAFMGGSRENEKRTEIANRASAVIGSDVTITDFDTDPSPAAARIRLLYPTARDFVLSAYDWEFASVDQNVSVSGTAAWSIPNGFVKLVSVRDAEGNAMRTIRSGRTLTIYSSSPSSVTATVRYVSSAIQNFESSMPSLFSEAVVMKLAAILSGETQADQQNGERQKKPDFATALAAAIAAEQAERAFMGGSRNKDDEKRTEIANRAIAKLGSESTISDFSTDQTNLAARIRLLWTSGVNRVLRLRDWDFAAVEQTTRLTGADDSGYCRYQIPEDCVNIVRVMDERRNPIKTVRNRDFLMIRGDGVSATVRYITKDFTLANAPEEFVDLLALDLADRLAPTVLRDAKAAASVQAQLRTQFGETDMKEANETAFGGEWRNPFIAARD